MASENWEAYFAECDRDSVPETCVESTGGYGYRRSADPEEHGGLDAGFVTLAAVWMELGRLTLTGPMCCTSCRAGSTPSCAKAHKSGIDKILALRGTGKQMWNSAITEPARAPTWVA
ncbi:acyl-CoA dehydrogenase family protein [Shigella flexneri]